MLESGVLGDRLPNTESRKLSRPRTTSVVKIPSTILEEPDVSRHPATLLWPENRVNSMEKRKEAKARKARLKLAPGPPSPNFTRLIENKDFDEIAAQMDISREQLEEITANRNKTIEVWAPVLAKLTRVVRVGLLRLLNRDYSKENLSVGQTICRMLNNCGRTSIENVRSSLSSGWKGWKYTLDENTIENFLHGRCAEAEYVADILLRFANATDKTNIYGIFV